MITREAEGGENRLSWWKSDFAIIGYFAAFKLALNGAFITRYGFQRDELYFIACGRHLAFGYVDHGPMVPWIARLTQSLFGESLIALRVFPLPVLMMRASTRKQADQ